VLVRVPNWEESDRNVRVDQVTGSQRYAARFTSERPHFPMLRELVAETFESVRKSTSQRARRRSDVAADVGERRDVKRHETIVTCDVGERYDRP